MEKQWSLALDTIKKRRKKREQTEMKTVSEFTSTLNGSRRGRGNKCKNCAQKWHMKIDCPTKGKIL